MVEGGTALLAGADHQLEDLGITLPPPPTPFGAYVEAVQSGNLVFLVECCRLSAMSPSSSDELAAS